MAKRARKRKTSKRGTIHYTPCRNSKGRFSKSCTRR